MELLVVYWHLLQAGSSSINLVAKKHTVRSMLLFIIAKI